MEQALHIYSDDQGNEYLRYAGKVSLIARIPMTYQFPTFASLAAGANGQQQIVIDSGSDFLWTYGALAFDLAAAAFTYTAQPIPNMSVQLSDSGESYNFQNAAVPVMGVFGRPGMPLKKELPYLFAGGATVTAIVTNYDAASATGNLRLSMIGQKIRYLKAIN